MPSRVPGTFLWKIAVVGVVVACPPQPRAVAQPIAVESFDYPADAPLAGKNGGSGWQGAWLVSPLVRTDNRVVGTSMSYPALRVAGRRMEQVGADVRSFRKLDLGRQAVGDLVTAGDHGPALGKTGTTIWVGFLIANPSFPKQAYGGIHLCDGLGDLGKDPFGDKKAHQRISLGRSNTSKGWYLGRVTNGGPGAGKWDSNVRTDGQTRLLVYRFDFHEGDVEGWLFIDPPPQRAPDPKTAALHAQKITRFHFNTLSVGCGAGATFHLDEIRIGRTFADVAPVK
jgi:hypothetical protein